MDPVKHFLEHANADYEFIVHPQPIYSVADGVAHFGIDPGQTAPTLILQTDKGYYSLVFSGSRQKIDFAALAIHLGVSHVKLVNKNKVQSITGFAHGDTPMIGLSLPAIFDKKLLQFPFVYGGSGLSNRTLKISPVTLLELVQPVFILENNVGKP